MAISTFRSLLCICVLYCLVCHAHGVRHVLHEKRDHVPASWVKRGRVVSSTSFSVRVGLAQQNLHKAESHLLDISDPDSPRYGKHWTAEEVVEEFRPSEQTVQAVRTWLHEHGGIQPGRVTHSGNKAWLAFDASASELENLLHAEYHDHEHVSGSVVPGCSEYYVAEHVRPHIDYITPGIHLPMYNPVKMLYRRSEAPSESQPAPCSETVTPACIRQLYNIPESGPTANPQNEFGIFEDGSYYAQADLNQFYTGFNISIPKGTHPEVDSIDGGVSEMPQGMQNTPEATLDIQVAYPLIYPQKIRLLQTNDVHYGIAEGLPNTTIPDGFNNLLDALDGSYCTYEAYGEKGNDPNIDPSYPDPAPGNGSYEGKLMCGVYKPTNVISISLAGQEADVPASYQKRQCNEFMKLGLQGVTIVVPSGDTGVRAYPPAEGNTGCLGPKKNIFSPMWPSTCPWVLTVGGSMIGAGKSVTDPEEVAHSQEFLFSSGGGFSNLYPRPAYQSAAVGHFFSAHDPSFKYYSHIFNSTAAVRSGKGVAESGGVYNRIGRGIPDVAAIAFNVGIVFNGTQGNFGAGTSAAVPLFAALVNRINEARLMAYKKPVGFINPILYKNPHVLRDITVGDQNGCGPTNNDQAIGFSAVEGWDPATGLGTPDYQKLLELFMNLP